MCIYLFEPQILLLLFLNWYHWMIVPVGNKWAIAKKAVQQPIAYVDFCVGRQAYPKHSWHVSPSVQFIHP